MELAMKGLVNVIVYIHDILLHSKIHQEHRLRNTNLKVNLKNCEFGVDNLSYLGYRLTPDGILPGSDKLKSFQDSETPKTVHQVRQFMGLCTFFRSHIPDLGTPSQVNKKRNKMEEW
jgi:hypothetical protein